MRLLLLVAICCLIGIHAKTVKKVPKDVLLAKGENGKVSPKQPAILAIEIVDSNDTEEEPEPDSPKNKGKSKPKNAKRTIETSLGYGYQNSFGSTKPKFEIYKYSQEDIQPFAGGHPGQKQLFTPNHGHSQSVRGKESNFHVQKSIQYDLGTQTYIEPPENHNYYQNQGYTNDNGGQQHQPTGTTLYTTIDQTGHLGQLSNNVPYQNTGHDSNGLVPVIILRVYTNQLSNPSAFYPNLPQSHPYSHLNNVNLQSLLGSYIQPNSQDQHYQEPQQNYVHASQYQPTYRDNSHGYSHDHLDTHENYPDDKHTKVIFHKNFPSTKAPSPIVYRTPPTYNPVISSPQHVYTNQDDNGYYYPNPSQVAYESNPSYHYQDGQNYQYHTQKPIQYQMLPSVYPIPMYDYDNSQHTYESQQAYSQHNYPEAQYQTGPISHGGQPYLPTEEDSRHVETTPPYNYHAHSTGRRNVEIVQEVSPTTPKPTKRRSVGTRKVRRVRTKKTVEDSLDTPTNLDTKKE